ncbi:CUB and sushi domain-containing protein 3-like protein [Leptotrombidium deliense]|uniref:CUB and sushi domain-containing protein 3-like protein n=1 Tax=Leptotrombidium deliense TaxID=299467 RepID=A0A443SS44_9ACAR|nr:CUB and sushi domain-containing protein 3-like protein [Leptotrombidium deliense]
MDVFDTKMRFVTQQYVGFKNESFNLNVLSINLDNNTYVVGVTLKVFSTNDVNIISMSNIKNVECEKTQLGLYYSFKCHTTIVKMQSQGMNTIDVSFDQNVSNCNNCNPRLVTLDVYEYDDECETPDKPLFGYVKLEHKRRKQYAYYCNSGFNSESSKKTRCENGDDWSDYEPLMCLPKLTCSITEIDSNVNAVYSDLWSSDEALIGSTVKYKCIERFSKMLGHRQQTCTANGTWSGSVPKCVRNTFHPGASKSTKTKSYHFETKYQKKVIAQEFNQNSEFRTAK